MTTQATVLTLVTLIVLSQVASGQDAAENATDAELDAPAGATGEIELLAYRPSRVTAEELADAVGEQFSKADGVRFSVAGDGKILLVRMPPSIRPRVVKLLQELDHSLEALTIEVITILTSKPLEDTARLTGDARIVEEAISLLETQGLGYVARRRRFVLFDGRETTVSFARMTGRSISSRTVGLIPRVDDAGDVVLELEVEGASGARNAVRRSTVRTREGQAVLVPDEGEPGDDDESYRSGQFEYLVLSVAMGKLSVASPVFKLEFDRRDRNHDGILNGEEFQRLAESSLVDRDNDGEITFREYERWSDERLTAEIQSVFARSDRNGDGTVDGEEGERMLLHKRG